MSKIQKNSSMELQPFVHLPTKKQAMEYLIIRWGGGEGGGGGGCKREK